MNEQEQYTCNCECGCKEIVEHLTEQCAECRFEHR